MSNVSGAVIEALKGEALDARRFLVNHTAKHTTHLGGALSATEMLTALYFRYMRVRPENPEWEDRDLFILSKGHVGIALYYFLAKKGFFPLEDLDTYEQVGTIFGTHPSNKIPGADVTTGSLGHGLSVGLGMAVVGKRDRKDFRVYVMLGDAELQEGSIWEAAMAAKYHELDNLVAIVDHNGRETTENMLAIDPIEGKFESFGWSTAVIDGHDMGQIVETMDSLPFETGKPSLIVANTIKGKGISFLEGRAESHNLFLDEERAKRALADLEASL